MKKALAILKYVSQAVTAIVNGVEVVIRGWPSGSLTDGVDEIKSAINPTPFTEPVAKTDTIHNGAG